MRYYLIFGVMLLTTISAGEITSPSPLFSGAGKNSDALPPLSINLNKKSKANICPSCHTERSKCYEQSMEAKNNPATSKFKICPVYQETFLVGESRPYNCPICASKVNLPLRNQRYENSDADLCPHPNGNIRYMPEISTCARCGFSAFQKDFLTRQNPAIIAWVKTNLQAGMTTALHNILGREVKIDSENLIALFSLQKEIPDTMRCVNAYAIYNERMRLGDREVNAAGLARMAWLTAWAHRRAISEPFGEGVLLDSARKVLSAIQKAEIAENEQEEGIRLLTELYRNTDRFDIMERQIMRIVQAGYYNRLGLNFWADGVLRQVEKELEKKYANPGSDPWQKISLAKDLSGAEKEELVQLARKALRNAVSVRLQCLTMEQKYLAYAVNLLAEALSKNLYPAEETPTYFYLVGEFERRRENHARSLFWLQAAEQIAGTEIKLEHCAPIQIDLLKRYVRDRAITPVANPFAQKDRQLASGLALRVKQAQTQALLPKKENTPNLSGTK